MRSNWNSADRSAKYEIQTIEGGWQWEQMALFSKMWCSLNLVSVKFSCVICSVENCGGHISFVISVNIILRPVSFRLLATSLLHFSPFFSSPGSFLHFVVATLQACCLSSRAQRFCSTLDVPLVGKKTKREPKSKRKKSGVGEAKDGIDGGKNELCFHVHSLSFWCTHQNNLRPTAATPSG